jgi:hypothetical protein
MTDVAAGGFGNHRRALALLIGFATLAALTAMVLAASGSARARPMCFGKPATIVGTNGADKISTKLTAGKDIVAARGGNDTIEANSTRNNHGQDIICGDDGNDEITANNEANTLIGGPGNDEVKGAPGNDLIVGDNANPKGNEGGKTGSDDLNGTGGNDFLVGDNYASGDATGASADKDNVGLDGNDVVIGDSASLNGDATGGKTDRVAGADGNDLVVGDSYAPHGAASGSGDDEGGKASLNAGPGKDLLVGDNYTKDGTASGGGKDELQGADGGDFNEPCKPGTCDDVFYGDNYSAACGPKATLVAITCQAAMAPGGAPDRLTPDMGDDFMNGGDPDGDLRSAGDVCSGGKGNDTGTRCELYAKGDTEHEIFFP